MTYFANKVLLEISTSKGAIPIDEEEVHETKAPLAFASTVNKKGRKRDKK
jgi:hypothetical protein